MMTAAIRDKQKIASEQSIGQRPVGLGPSLRGHPQATRTRRFVLPAGRPDPRPFLRSAAGRDFGTPPATLCPSSSASRARRPRHYFLRCDLAIAVRSTPTDLQHCRLPSPRTAKAEAGKPTTPAGGAHRGLGNLAHRPRFHERRRATGGRAPRLHRRGHWCSNTTLGHGAQAQGQGALENRRVVLLGHRCSCHSWAREPYVKAT